MLSREEKRKGVEESTFQKSRMKELKLKRPWKNTAEGVHYQRTYITRHKQGPKIDVSKECSLFPSNGRYWNQGSRFFKWHFRFQRKKQKQKKDNKRQAGSPKLKTKCLLFQYFWASLSWRRFAFNIFKKWMCPLCLVLIGALGDKTKQSLRFDFRFVIWSK